MRPLALGLLALLVMPVTALGQDRDAPVRVIWSSTPENVRARGTWDARLSVLQGPGGFDEGNNRPVIVVTELDSGAKRRVRMRVDVPPNTFRALVTFPRAGLYHVSVVGFDPRHPSRIAGIGAPVRIEPTPPSRGASSPSLAILVAATIGALLAGAWIIRGAYSPAKADRGEQARGRQR
jgi:hypothetical protein